MSEATESPMDIDTTTTTPETRLVDIAVTDQNVALNLMVSFLNLAQRRGAFSLDEAAKVWECLQSFIVEPLPTPEMLSQQVTP